jgi:uncharacterized hydrophobic protein (TIGR00271 family)
MEDLKNNVDDLQNKTNDAAHEKAVFTADDFEPSWRDKLKDLFSLKLDVDEADTHEQITNSIDFKGGNLWALLFATVLAAVGLNINSVAVIIGAMLISPLMNPIVAVGYSAARIDVSLLRTAARNLGLMVLVSLLAAFLYFLLSPLKEATNEILMRVRPTLYDVIIAISGGAIGIIGATQRNKNVLSLAGVAIATALMPALAVAGYGLATGQLNFFVGGLFLFFINSVFISLTSLLFTRLFLQFPTKQYLEPKQEQQAKYMLGFLIALAVIPSIFTAIQVIREAIFINRANFFIKENLSFSNTTILKPYGLNYNLDTATIELVLIGEPLPAQVVESIQTKLKDERFNLGDAKLVLRQSNNSASYYGGQLNNNVVESALKTKDLIIEEQRKRIAVLETGGKTAVGGSQAIGQQGLIAVSKKLRAFFPEIKRVAYNEMLNVSADGGVTELMPTFLVNMEGELDKDMKEKISNFLKIELDLSVVEVIGY